MRFVVRTVSLLLALAWGVSSGSGEAATATTTFRVAANINASCTISATDLNFGDYVGIQINAQSRISLVCTNNTFWNVGLNEGTSPGATVTTRRMTGPASSFLDYSLLQQRTSAGNWGNTVGVDTIAGFGSGGTQVLFVNGVLGPGQLAKPPGGYTDTITATITF